MGSLSNLYISASYTSLVHLGNDGPITSLAPGQFVALQDGLGNNLQIELNNSGDVNIGGILSASNIPTDIATQAELNAYTQSTNIRLNNIETTTASLNISVTNINSFTSSQNTKNTTLSTYTASVNTKFDAVGGSTASLNAFTASNGNTSLNAYTASQDTKNATLAVYTASVNTKFDAVGGSTSSLNAFTASQQSFNASATASILELLNLSSSLSGGFVTEGELAAATGSLINQINTKLNTSSFNAYTQSNDNKVNSLINATSSYAISSSVALVDYNQQQQINSLIAVTASFLTSSTDISSLNAFTASQETKNSTLASVTASLNNSVSLLNSFTQSQTSINTDVANSASLYNAKWNTLGGQTGSYVTSAITASSLVTASVNLNTITFTKGDATTFNINVNTGSATDISSLNQFTASQLNINSGYNTFTSSQLTINSAIGASTASLNTFSSSVLTQLSTLENVTSSLISKTGSYATTGSNNFIGDQTITGNLTAFSASFTYLQTIYESSSIIYSSGSNQFGDELTDVQTLSGSVKVQGSLTVNGTPVLTSSVDISGLVTTASFNAYTSSNNQRVDSLESNSASVNISISNINSTTASLNSSVSNLNSFSASTLISINALNTNSASVNISISNINSTTASLNSSVSNLNQFTASQTTASIVSSLDNLNTFSASTLIRLTNIESTTASLNTSISNLNTATSSLFTSASLSLVTASFDTGNRNLTFTKGNATTFSVNIPDVSGSSIPTGTVSGSAQIVELGFLQTSSFNSYTSSTNSSITQLNASSASQQISIDALNTNSASVNISISNLNSATSSLFGSASLALVTASVNLNTITFTKGDTSTFNIVVNTGSAVTTDITALNSFTASQETKNSTLASVTSSLNSATASLFTSASLSLVTASFSGNTLTFTKGDTSTFGVVIPDISGSTIDTGSFMTTGSVAVNVLTFTKGDGTTFDLTVAASGSAPAGTVSSSAQIIAYNVFATTGSNNFKGSQNISSSANIGDYLGTDYVFISQNGIQLENAIQTNINFNAANNFFSAGGNFFLGNTLGGVGSGSITVTANNGGNVSVSGSQTNIAGVNFIPFSASLDSRINAATGNFVTTSSFNSYTTSVDSSLSNINSFTASQNTKNTTLQNLTGSFATTGSNTFIGNETFQDAAGNASTLVPTSGSLMLVAKTFTSASAHLTSSAANFVNLIFKNNSNTADTIISGSNNIFTNPQAPTAGYKRYIGGSNNLHLNNTAGIAVQITASAASVSGNRPSMNNNIFQGVANFNINQAVNTGVHDYSQNFYNGGATTTINALGFTGSLNFNNNFNVNGSSTINAASASNNEITGGISGSGTLSIQNNGNFGGTMTITSPRRLLTTNTQNSTSNVIAGGSITVTNISSSAAVNANSNYANGAISYTNAGAAGLGLHTSQGAMNFNYGALTVIASASAVASNLNYSQGPITITNQAWSSSLGLGQFAVSRNIFNGQSTTLLITGSVDGPAGSTPGAYTDNAVIGKTNTIFSNQSGAGYHNSFISNVVGGENLIISASNSFTSTIGGGAYFGRYNANDGVRNKTGQTVFFVGTGTSTARKTGFLIDSGSNSYFEGTLNVSGSTTMTGSLILSSSNATELFVIGDSQFTGSVKVASTFQLQLPTGSNQQAGTAVLDGANPGTVTVSNSLVTANSIIMLTKQTLTNAHMVAVSSKGAGTFTITSNGNGDNDTVGWFIINNS